MKTNANRYTQSVSLSYSLLLFMSSTGKALSSESAHHLHNSFRTLVQRIMVKTSAACPEYQLELDKAHSLDLSKISASDRIWEVVKIVMRVTGHRKGLRWEAGRTAKLRFLAIIRRRFKELSINVFVGLVAYTGWDVGRNNLKYKIRESFYL